MDNHPYGLLDLAWEEYDKFTPPATDHAVGVPDSMPILYFGDQCRYSTSGLRVITVATNPSCNEFPKGDTFSRFPAVKPVALSIPQHPEIHFEALDHYFEHDPLCAWFRHLEPVLNGLQATYRFHGTCASKKAEVVSHDWLYTALHTDLCSPAATSPQWGKLEKETQEALRKGGAPLWRKLVAWLAPHVVLGSGGPANRELLSCDITDGWHHFHTYCSQVDTGKALAKPYVVLRGKLKDTADDTGHLFWGPLFRQPFGPLSNGTKRDLGLRIAQFVK